MTSKFVYVTYIRTTPAKLWDALTKPEFTMKYWLGAKPESDWKAGSPWRLMLADGRVTDAGEILEAEPEKRIVIKWRNELMPELKAEGFGRCTFEIRRQGDAVKLTVTHEIELDNSKLIDAVSDGWPKILAGLKTYLETGRELEMAHVPGESAARAAGRAR